MAIAGHKTVIQYDSGSTGSLVDISQYCNAVSGLDLQKATLESTAFGSAAQTFFLGLEQSPQVSLAGDFDATLDAHMQGVRGTTAASQTIKVSFGGTASGQPYVQVETVLSNYAVSSSAGDKVTWSATLQRTGAPIQATN